MIFPVLHIEAFVYLGLPIVKLTSALTFDRVAVKEQYFTELRWCL